MPKKDVDIPKNIVVLVLMIVIVVSVMGTWMILDKISNVETSIESQIFANTEGDIALNIEYDAPENKTQQEIKRSE